MSRAHTRVHHMKSTCNHVAPPHRLIPALLCHAGDSRGDPHLRRDAGGPARSADAYERLCAAEDARGRRIEVHKIHQPGPLFSTQVPRPSAPRRPAQPRASSGESGDGNREGVEQHRHARLERKSGWRGEGIGCRGSPASGLLMREGWERQEEEDGVAATGLAKPRPAGTRLPASYINCAPPPFSTPLVAGMAAAPSVPTLGMCAAVGCGGKHQDPVGR